MYGCRGNYNAPIERKAPSFTERINALDSMKAGKYEAAYPMLAKLIENNSIEVKLGGACFGCFRNLYH